MSLDFVNFLKEIGLCDAAQTAVLKSDAALDRDSLAPLCQPLFDPEADEPARALENALGKDPDGMKIARLHGPLRPAYPRIVCPKRHSRQHFYRYHEIFVALRQRTSRTKRRSRFPLGMVVWIFIAKAGFFPPV